MTNRGHNFFYDIVAWSIRHQLSAPTAPHRPLIQPGVNQVESAVNVKTCNSQLTSLYEEKTRQYSYL